MKSSVCTFEHAYNNTAFVNAFLVGTCFQIKVQNPDFKIAVISSKELTLLASANLGVTFGMPTETVDVVVLDDVAAIPHNQVEIANALTSYFVCLQYKNDVRSIHDLIRRASDIRTAPFTYVTQEDDIVACAPEKVDVEKLLNTKLMWHTAHQRCIVEACREIAILRPTFRVLVLSDSIRQENILPNMHVFSVESNGARGSMFDVLIVDDIVNVPDDRVLTHIAPLLAVTSTCVLLIARKHVPSETVTRLKAHFTQAVAT